MKKILSPNNSRIFLYILFPFILHLSAYSSPSDTPLPWQNYLSKSNARGAKSDFMNALSKDANNPQLWLGLATADKALGNYNQTYFSTLTALDLGRYDSTAELTLVRAYELLPYSNSPHRIIEICESIEKDEKCSPYLKSVVSWYLSYLYRQEGDLDSARKAIAKLGIIDQYLVLGPFDNEGKVGFDTPYPPETEINMDTTYSGKLVDAKWFKPSAKPEWGNINLNSTLQPHEKVTGYVLTYVYCPTAQDAGLRLGGSGLKAWVNGELLLSNPAIRMAKFDQEHVPILLASGWNQILIKTGILTGTWDLYVRVTDREGNSIPGLKYSVEPGIISSYQKPDLEKLSTQITQKAIRKGILYDLEKICKENPTDAMAYADLAYLYTYRKIQDENSQENILAIETALAIYPKSTYLKKIYADCQPDDNLRLQQLESASSTDSTDVELFIRLGDMDARAGLSESAIKKYQKSIDLNPFFGIGYYNLGAESRNRGWDEEAIQYFSKVTSLYPNMADAYFQLANLANERLSKSNKILLLEKSLSVNPTYSPARDQLMEIYLNAGDMMKYNEFAQYKLQLNPFDTNLYRRNASIAFQNNHFTDALKSCAEGLAISPLDSDLLKLQGLIYHKQGNMEDAKKSWVTALKSKPNDVWLTEYISFLAPESEKYYFPYRVTLEKAKEFSLDSVDISEANVVTLLDQEVTRVFEDGNSSQYHHTIAKVLTDDGIKQLSYQSISYSPNRQKIEIIKCRIMKPDGTIVDGKEAGEYSASNAGARLYYDYLVKQYSFPGLEKGSYIDFEYKVDDTHNNLYADYFGDMFYVGNYDPTVKSQFVLITPTSRKFYFYTEKIAKPSNTETSETNHTQTYRWDFSNLGYIEREPYMPSYSEMIPYIKVSSFSKWDEVAKWYWNLIQDQFVAPDDLKETVHKLTDDKKTQLDKVKAIYDFTVTDVRYLGLEFGISGYKPHKAMEIFRARYGDCKDKATLLITMLREIGIPADIVLIRTKDLGEIDYTLPSLGLFNHAIAHIPNLDGKEIWLDGTAMYCAMNEFPNGDQNRHVFCINSSRGIFTNTTSFNEDHSIASYQTDIQLMPDGSASGKRITQVSGSFAPGMRYYFANPAKIQQDVERQFNSQFPGTKINTVDHSDFENLNLSPELKISFDSPQLASKSGDRLQIPTNFFPNRLTDGYARRSERIHPMKFALPWTRKITTVYHLPSGYKLDFKPQDIDSNHTFGRFQLNYTLENDTFTLNEVIQFKAWELDAKEYSEFRAWCNLIDRKEDEKLVFISGK